MNTHRHATQRTLYEWEKELETLFRDIRLVGELPLGNPGRAELAQYIRALIKRHGLTQATHLLEERYPRSFLTYLTLTASRNEERGFWDVVAREVSVAQSGQFFHHSHHWGRIFQNLLSRFKLGTFPGVQSSNAYITLIRLHGGIPAYSLPDFFTEVLLPTVQKHQYAGMDVPELIEQVLQRSVVQNFVDSPVRYFLEYGGETAQDFFAHCLEMARAWEEQGSLPSAKKLGLPRYVMRTFQEFMEGRLQTPRGKRLRAPRLHLEPYDPEYLYSLELPEEPIDADRAGWRYAWRITEHTEAGEEELAPVSVRVHHSGGALVAAGDTLWLDQPPSRLRVEFQARDPETDPSRIIIIGRWFLDLAPPAGEPPLLAFRPRDGRPVHRGATLPADELWLMVPADLDVQAPRQGRLIAHAPELGSAWAAWKIEMWDLTQAQVLHLVEPESGKALHTRQVQVSPAEPHLLDRGRLDAEMDREETPFYVGEPPRLWLPRLTGQAAEEEMAAWRVQVSAVGDADPMPSSRKATLMELAGQVDDEGFLLPMATLLRDRAAGAYTVEVWGPRRFHGELAFRIWPILTVEGLAAYYLPGSQGHEPVVFHVQAPQAHRVVASADATGVQVEATESPGRHRVTVAVDATLAELILSQPGPEKTAIQVPLRLRVPRLRWTVRLVPGKTVWTTQPLIVPVDKLLQSQRPYLILAWENAQAAPEGRVALLDAEKQSGEVLQGPEVVGLAQSNRMGINLGCFHDTLAAARNASLLTLALVLDRNVEGEPVPLLHLRRELGVSVALLERTDAGSVVLHWEATHRLRNRRVRVWSAWRPWEPPQEYAIPDAVAPEYPHDPPGSGAFEIGEACPPACIGWLSAPRRSGSL